jgi:hypothetical protein
MSGSTKTSDDYFVSSLLSFFEVTDVNLSPKDIHELQRWDYKFHYFKKIYKLITLAVRL